MTNCDSLRAIAVKRFPPPQRWREANRHSDSPHREVAGEATFVEDLEVVARGAGAVDEEEAVRKPLVTPRLYAKTTEHSSRRGLKRSR